MTAPDAWLPRILLVDDSATRRTMFADRLRGLGFSVRSAGDGRAALDLLASVPAEQRPELVLSDVDMPHLDGLGLASRIRAHAPYRDLVVLLYSSSRLDGDGHLEAVRAGATECLKGAVDFADLEALVMARVKIMRSLRRLADARASISGAIPVVAAGR